MNKEQITSKINSNPLEAEGYEMFGDYLLSTNPRQAYLCYENALFYAKDETQKSKLGIKIDLLKKMKQDVPKAAIIILSYNLKEDVRINIESIRETTPISAREIIVVDNASEDDSVEYLLQQKDIILKANVNNEGFPKGCNQGIELAEKDSDIFLLNNDTVMFPNTLFWLRMGLYEKEKHGAAGCVTNNIGGLQKVVDKDLSFEECSKYAFLNNVYQENALEYRPLLVGFALLVKRAVVNQIGILDENFFPGNYEDDDFCLRIMKAGYSNVVVHNSFLYHAGSKSFKKRNDFAGILMNNKVKFEEKHEVFDSDYIMNPNPTLLSIFQEESSSREINSLLELNYTFGAFAYRTKYLKPNLAVMGISNRILSEKYAIKEDYVNLKQAYTIDEYKNILGDSKFDFIVVNCYQDDNNSIEEYVGLVDSCLAAGGKAVFMLENSRYYGNWLPLLMGKKPNRDIKKDSLTNERFVKALENRFYAEKWIFEYKFAEDKIEKKLIEDIESLVSELGYKKDEINHIRYYVMAERL